MTTILSGNYICLKSSLSYGRTHIRIQTLVIVWLNVHRIQAHMVPFIPNACAPFHAHLYENTCIKRTDIIFIYCGGMYIHTHIDKYTRRTINAFKLIYFLSETELNVSNH